MAGYINIIYLSVTLSVLTVFFLTEDCKDKKKGFIVHLAIELVYNYISLRILRMTETGAALPQTIVWRIVLYVVYMTFRLGWFRLFTGNCYRNFLLVYFYVWGSADIVVLGVYWVWNMILPEELVLDSLSIMPETYPGLLMQMTASVLCMFVMVWFKRRNWLQRLSTQFLCILFAIVFVLADVGSTFLLVRPYLTTETYLKAFFVNVVFLLAAAYFGYVNYLRITARKENERIQKTIERQFRSYEALSRKENEIRKIRHDLANHLQIIREAEESERKKITGHYQEQLRQTYEDFFRDNGKEGEEEEKKKTVPKAAAWGIFTVFAVDTLMVIIVSQLILNKVFTYESMIVGQLAVILFTTLYVWLTFRRTKKENGELSRKINDVMESPDLKRIMSYLDEIISNLNMISSQEEEEVIEQLDRVKFSVVTGNKILDSMLWHKNSLCRELSVVMEMEWNLPEDVGIEDMDMIGLVGNLLDNAIEACSRVKYRERLIQVKSKQHANIMSIRVRNTKNEYEEPVKNQFRTIKNDTENHGIGMQIIRSIVDKYDGTIQYYDEKTELTILVNLQV